MEKQFLNKDEFETLVKLGINKSKYKYYFCWNDDINNGVIVHKSMKNLFKNSYQTISFFELINLLPSNIDNYYFEIDINGKWLGYEYLPLNDTECMDYLHVEYFRNHKDEIIDALYKLIIWYYNNKNNFDFS